MKEKLQEAVDQFDPISTMNIIDEAIRKIEERIEEDKNLGRATKSLENRLKKVNAKIYRTDKSGTILLTSTGDKIKIKEIKTDVDGG